MSLPHRPVPRTALAALALAALALAAAPLAAAPLAAQPADSVSLRFAWPDTLTARVEQEWTRTEQGGRAPRAVRAVTRYRMRVLPHPEGRLVRADSVAVVSATAARTARGPDMQAMVARLAAFQPSYVISAGGEFLRLHDPAGARAGADSIMAPLMAQMPDAPPQVAALMAQATSEQTLTASARKAWSALAGTWIGHDWALRQPYGYRTEEPVPLWQGLTLAVNHQVQALARVPCAAGEGAARCVRLELRSQPDPEAMRGLVRRLLAELAPAQARQVAQAVQSLDAEVTVTLVADPATLVPHSLVETRRVRVQGTDRGRAAAGVRVDRRTVRFRYGP